MPAARRTFVQARRRARAGRATPTKGAYPAPPRLDIEHPRPAPEAKTGYLNAEQQDGIVAAVRTGSTVKAAALALGLDPQQVYYGTRYPQFRERVNDARGGTYSNRPRKFGTAQQQAFLDALAEGLTFEAAAAHVKCSTTTIQKRMQTDLDFRAQTDVARAAARRR